jgi:uncharacterized membrane protein
MARRVFTEPEEGRIVAAIAAAEKGNRGEVRVHVEQTCKGDPLVRARDRFHKLAMGNTSQDTAVLLFVAPGSRTAAVWAGQALYDGGADQWKAVVEAIAKDGKDGKVVDGIVAGLNKIGEILRAKLPGDDRSGDELPNTVTSS